MLLPRATLSFLLDRARQFLPLNTFVYFALVVPSRSLRIRTRLSPPIGARLIRRGHPARNWASYKKRQSVAIKPCPSCSRIQGKRRYLGVVEVLSKLLSVSCTPHLSCDRISARAPRFPTFSGRPWFSLKTNPSIKQKSQNGIMVNGTSFILLQCLSRRGRKLRA